MAKKKLNLNKSQRMQIKAYICLLGFFLLFFLIFLRLLNLFVHDEEGGGDTFEVHEPVIEQLTNVWVLGADNEGLKIFADEERLEFAFDELFIENNPDSVTVARDEIADVKLRDGRVCDINIKNNKINAKVFSVADGMVELEGYGKLDLTDDSKVYKTYGEPAMCGISDIVIGYNFADFVIEDGEICAVLLTGEEKMENIRVLIKASGYSGIYHDELIVSSDSEFSVTKSGSKENTTENYPAGSKVSFDINSPYFDCDRVIISPNINTGRIRLDSVSRSLGAPSYRGNIELMFTSDGIVVVNELSLEEYLYCVVPSEMPSSYPEEALKAQAICARTYAYSHMEHAAYSEFGAHLDDSTTYQVYNNIPEVEKTTNAVKGSFGKLLYTDDERLANTFYYSTSCGIGTDANVWKTNEAATIKNLRARQISRTGADVVLNADSYTDEEKTAADNIGEWLMENDNFESYISETNPDDFEYGEGYYRWSYAVKELDTKHICEVLKKRQSANKKLVLVLDKDNEFVEGKINDFNKIKDLFISKRGVGGVGDELIIVTDAGTYKIITEHNIRYVLCDGVSKLKRQDGKSVACESILPSAFFSVSVVKSKGNVVGYTLTGGGFGHGVGMSQNAAKEMAKAGLCADDILNFFFGFCEIRNIYE